MTIVCTTSIGVIIKLAEPRVSDRLTMLLFNYIVATSVSFLLLTLGNGQSTSTLSTISWYLAPVGGFIFALNFFLIILAIKKRGVALPVSLMRLSAIVPVGVSLIFLGENPGILQILGMIGALTAAVMMSLSFRGGEQKLNSLPEPKIILALSSIGLLLCFGLADLSMRLFEEFADPSEKPLFLAILFGCAGLTVGIAMIIGKTKINLTDILWGIGLGIPNYFASWFTVTALTELPSYIVFPSVTAATVMLIALIGRVFFKEDIGRWGLVGILLTLLSIVAINL